jgi:Uma2 family endonuclease
MAIGSPGAAREVTWEDFLALDEDDPRELIDGVLVEVDVPTELHEHIVIALGSFLFMWARTHGGRVLGSGYRVRISDRRGVMPDVQYFGPESARRLEQPGLAEGHPDLAVEVVSETSRRYDRVTKLGWYAEIGTPEYWIVDPAAHTLERLLLRDGRFVIAEALAEDAAFRPESFPGLEILLAELWILPGEGGATKPRDRGESEGMT